MSKVNTDPAARPRKKPIYKRWWFWAIIVMLIIGFAGGGADDQETVAPADTTPAPTEAPTQADVLDFDVQFYSEFRNDVTGRWRKALVATYEVIQDYAVDYYRAYFKADNEVHVIYNFTLKTVNCLTVSGDTLIVRVTEYVDGEEHDAKVACSGLSLASYRFSISSGEQLSD